MTAANSGEIIQSEPGVRQLEPLSMGPMTDSGAELRNDHRLWLIRSAIAGSTILASELGRRPSTPTDEPVHQIATEVE